MAENLRDRSSDLRELIQDDLSENDDSDFEGIVEPCDGDSLMDFSSGSGEEYCPLPEDYNSEDSDYNRPAPDAVPSTSRASPTFPLPRPRPDSPQTSSRPISPQPSPRPNSPPPSSRPSSPTRRPSPNVPQPTQSWVRVYPPEAEKTPEFNVRASATGIRNCPPPNSEPILYFYLFFKTSIWNLMKNETNSYAASSIDKKQRSGEWKKSTRLMDWVDTNVQEMKKFIAIVINMGLTFRNNLKHYWDTDPYQKINFYPMAMPLRRFQLLLSMLHFNSGVTPRKGEPNYDPWFKIRPFIDSLNDSFKEHFIPTQEICLDESMVGMKNRCCFIQYLPNKRHARFGVKKFEVCDSRTSYVLHSELYSGKDFLSDGDEPLTQKIVLQLLSKCQLLDKGYHLFTDNWYTKIPLAEKLLNRGTYLTGTVNKRSKGLSKSVLSTKLGPRDTVYFRKDDILLVGYCEKKSRKPVYCLTTGCHAENKIIRSRKGTEGLKPVLIDKYNIFMGGIDNKDKSLYHSTTFRPSRKYWKGIFYNMLDMAIFDAYILYCRNTTKPLERRDFMTSLVRSLMEDAKPNAPPAEPETGHSLEKLPGTNGRLCIVCLDDKMRKKSNYWCPGCNSGIHKGCFHKLKHFWRGDKRGGKRERPASDSDQSVLLCVYIV